MRLHLFLRSFPDDDFIEWTTSVQIPSVAQLEAAISYTDNCTDVELNLVSDVETPGDCLGERTFQRCWNLEDECGNVSPTMCHTVTIEDTTPPVFDCALTGTCPQDETRGCNDFPPRGRFNRYG